MFLKGTADVLDRYKCGFNGLKFLSQLWDCISLASANKASKVAKFEVRGDSCTIFLGVFHIWMVFFVRITNITNVDASLVVDRVHRVAQINNKKDMG
jgi:hypothetical protein